MSFTIRLATCEDSPEIGAVHLASWRTSYSDMGIDDFLASMTVENRTARWQNWLCEPNSPATVYVAEVEGDLDTTGIPTKKIVGFAACGKDRDDDPEFTGELYAIYLLQEYQRQGIGQALVRTVAQTLLDQGHQKMILWVLAENPSARAFYEKCGGEAVQFDKFDFGGKQFDSVGYGWRDIHTAL